MAKKYGNGADQATSTALQATPIPGFVLPGYYLNSSPNYRDIVGNYWSSTAGSTDGAYLLSLNSSVVYPASSSSKYRGYSVRCVSR